MAKKPRLRKTAPTLREQAQAAKVEKSQNGRLRTVATKAKRPLKKIRLPQNKVTAPIRKAGRGSRRVLGWLVPRYFINSWREVKQVTWPSRRETWRLTGAVFVFAIVFGVMIAAVDKGLDVLFRNLVLK